MRTPTVFPAHPPPASAVRTLARAASFAWGATESSRSQKTSSAGSVGALASIRGDEPGTERQDRRDRMGGRTFRQTLDRWMIAHRPAGEASPGTWRQKRAGAPLDSPVHG